jgi:peptidoglycan hydrolase-like protein with peptidoglycan-binding domain
MNRTSTLTATALAAMLAGAPVAAFAWSNNSASNANGSPSTQSYNGTNAAQSGSSSMTGTNGQAMPSQQLSQSEVQDAQQKLQQEGFYKNGQIDGVVGPQTRQALQQFQQSKGLSATGQLDQQTLAALDVNGQGGQNPSVGNNGQGATGHQGG